ncbi:MAG TPA: hypothetical protein PKB10_11140, partial [Tepidisphaeraceae bacterium]|nr:hypothetical protein [Tepidisphaeraceae bacterium]
MTRADACSNRPDSTASRRRRYAVVGTGSRVVMFLDAIAGDYRRTSELVGLCDISPARMQWPNRRLREQFDLP